MAFRNFNKVMNSDFVTSRAVQPEQFNDPQALDFNNTNFFGEHSDFLGGELKERATRGLSPLLEKLLLQGRKDIARQAGSAREGIRESGAASGFRGANTNLFNELFAEQASQTSQLETSIGQVGEAQQAQALQGLLGLTQFQGGQQLGGARLGESSRQFDITTQEGRRQFEKMFGLKERELELAEEASGGGFFESLLKGVASTFTGGLSDVAFDALFSKKAGGTN
jgi:hypothetical protein